MQEGYTLERNKAAREIFSLGVDVDKAKRYKSTSSEMENSGQITTLFVIYQLYSIRFVGISTAYDYFLARQLLSVLFVLFCHTFRGLFRGLPSRALGQDFLFVREVGINELVQLPGLLNLAGVDHILDGLQPTNLA